MTKKIISTALAAALISGITANADTNYNHVSALKAAFENSSEIHILYNDTVAEYPDNEKPINMNGCVSLPFRTALEKLGAVVSYDEAVRTVTAVKGDTLIWFKLLDNVIYVTQNGLEYPIQLDAPMHILSDKTYMPVRTVGNALGMEVGWDARTESVIMIDADKYIDKLSKSAPSLSCFLAPFKNDFDKETMYYSTQLMYTRDGVEQKLEDSGSLTYIKPDGEYEEPSISLPLILAAISDTAAEADASYETQVSDDGTYTAVYNKFADSKNNTSFTVRGGGSEQYFIGVSNVNSGGLNFSCYAACKKEK